MTPLSDWLNVLPRGSGIAGVTELPLPPKDAVLPPYRPPPAVAALPPPPPAAELPSPPPAAAAAALPTPPPAQKQQEHRYSIGTSPPHHHFACCHPGRCHHHPHGSHGLNQAAEVRDEAWGEEEDKPGEPPPGTQETKVHMANQANLENVAILVNQGRKEIREHLAILGYLGP
ncbi:hypothetical protein EMCRGX_G004588 [Ephydatia muelleri]